VRSVAETWLPGGKDMFVQTSTSQLTDLQSFLTQMVAVSVAVERVIEILKQTIGTIPFINWIFTSNPNSTRDSWRCAVIHLVSAGIGALIAELSGITVPGVSDKAVSYVLIGLLSAGGSAFWNHALDLVKAAKVQKEQTAKMAVATTNGLPTASAVNL
jgi:hypothetical protein